MQSTTPAPRRNCSHERSLLSMPLPMPPQRPDCLHLKNRGSHLPRSETVEIIHSHNSTPSETWRKQQFPRFLIDFIIPDVACPSSSASQRRRCSSGSCCAHATRSALTSLSASTAAATTTLPRRSLVQLRGSLSGKPRKRQFPHHNSSPSENWRKRRFPRHNSSP